MVPCLINLGGLIAISLFLAVRFRDRLTATLPITLCSIVLVLYGLAFFRKLHWITGLLALCLLVLGALFVREVRRSGLSPAVRTACGPLRDPQFWINAAALILLLALVRYRQILEWDAYNFWGPDIKSLFFRNGFAERYSNPAANFGDYPPNVQLAIWWFLHLCGRFDEGLIFDGYFLYSGLLLFSVTSRLRLKRLSHQLIAGFAAVPLLFALPSVVDTSWYRALYMDPIMAILWGCLLCEIILEHTCTEGFQYYKCLVLLTAVTLTKSVGILWAAYAVVCYFLWHGKKHLLRAGGLAAAAAVSYGSWTLYCRLLERTTYLTDSLAPSVGSRIRELLQGTFFTSGNNWAYIKAYLKAFLFEPVHRAHTLAIDLTPLLVMALVFLVFFLFFLAGWLPKRQWLKLTGFLFGVYALTYFILLCSHLTIFFYETQYLEPANMLTQMTRYGSPMNLGFLILAAALCLEHTALPPDLRRGEYARTVLPCLAALTVLLCAGYSTMADCLIEGHDPLNPQRLEKRALFLDSYADFLEEITQIPLSGPGQRVLLLCSSAEYNPIVTFFASPVSVQTAYYNETTDSETLWRLIEQASPSWIYVQDGTEADQARLDSILNGCQLNTLYPLSRWSPPAAPGGQG